MGLFVVRDEQSPEGEAPPADAAAPDADAAAAAPDAAPPQAEFVKEPPAAPGGKVDFPAVYEAAGIDAEEQARVAKAAELLHVLPAGSEGGKQIVEASLKAFGVPIDKIIDAGGKEVRALDAYVAAGAADTKKVLADSQQRIAQYEEEIQRIRRVMDERVAEQQGVERACNDGKLEVARVLEFFGHAPAAGAASAAGAAPKPIDPSERSV